MAKKKTKVIDEVSQRKIFNRIAFSVFGILFCLFILISLLSFNIQDSPNPDVISSGMIANLCGPFGAMIAFYFEKYLGPSSLPILMFITFCLIKYCMNKPFNQTILRAIGLFLICGVLSGATYIFNSGNENTFSFGNGGVLGIAIGHFLLTKTATIGAMIILFTAFIVGLLLAADEIILKAPQIIYHLLQRFIAFSLTLATTPMAPTAIVSTPLGQSTVELEENITKNEYEYEYEYEEGDDEAETPQDEYEDETEDEDTENIEVIDVDVDNDSSTQTPEILPFSTENNSKRNTSLKEVSSALAKIRGVKPNVATEANINIDYSEYKYPTLDLLKEPDLSYKNRQSTMVQNKGRLLRQTLKEFKLEATVIGAETGPVVTMYEVQLAPGIKIARINSLSRDIARALSAPCVRIIGALPGKNTVGIEVPNSVKETVRIKELIQLAGDRPFKMQIPVFLGKDVNGEPLIMDMAAMPHCLIAGTTGSGKSVCINTLIISILLTQRPDMVKLILIDPKMVEMNLYADLAHLMCPIVTDMKKAEHILQWCTEKMDERYALLAEARVRNVVNYNKLTEEEIYERFKPSNAREKAKIPLRIPYIVVIIDELADLMMTSAKEVEAHIIRIAQKSRAIGIHLVLATQRPQATVVTGLIKSNMPTRIGFRVASKMDSRIVLDQNGAETLLGRGDMLFSEPGASDLIRAQGAFLDDAEINLVVDYVKNISQPSYHPELMQMNTLQSTDIDRDELFDQAVKVILQTGRGSVSLLQRRLTIGYSRASRLVDQMAAAGIVGEYKGSQAREVLLTMAEYDQIQMQMQRDAANGYGDMGDDNSDQAAEHITSDIDEEAYKNTIVIEENIDTASENVSFTEVPDQPISIAIQNIQESFDDDETAITSQDDSTNITFSDGGEINETVDKTDEVTAETADDEYNYVDVETTEEESEKNPEIEYEYVEVDEDEEEDPDAEYEYIEVEEEEEEDTTQTELT
jgi:S-DNA-T family DNA segregation ATPase FtsK/SpoIIIE